MTLDKLLKVLSFGTLGLLIVILVTATILEKMKGTAFVIQHVYTSPAILLLWAIVAVSSLYYLWKKRIQRLSMTLGLHLSFLLILGGALTTHWFGVQGVVHLRQEAPPTNTFQLATGGSAVFPFKVALQTFRLEYYPGTSAPMDFVSQLLFVEKDGSTQSGEVSMNRVYSLHHFRFYQSRYDADQRGSVLSVAYDPWGITITYTGYACLFVTMLGFFFQRESRFRILLRHPLLRGSALLLLFGGNPLAGRAEKCPQTLPRNTAEQFCSLYVYYHDRVCPLQTLARDFTVKLYGKSSYKGLSAEQVLTGWFFYYDDWKQEPMIRVKEKSIQSLLGIQGRYARLTDFTSVEGYKLEAALRGAVAPTVRRQAERANEQFNLISMVCTGSLLKIYPWRDTTAGRTAWYSLADQLPAEMPAEQWIFIRNSMNYVAEQVALKRYQEVGSLLGKLKKFQQKEANHLPSPLQFRAEQWYNRFHESRLLAMLCVTLGILTFVSSCRRMTRGTTGRDVFAKPLLAVLGMVGVYLTGMISLRGYISNHVPLSNGFETMQFMAWCSVVLTFCLHRRFALALPFGFLLCGLTLLVAMMGEANPHITQLMPVLQSPLLSVHVVVIMLAYVLLAFIALNGVTAVWLHHAKRGSTRKVHDLQVISQVLLYPAIFLLAIGIFVGAIWANVSWGRYWGWDPKEVWALITLLIYSLAIHSASLPAFRRPLFFHLFAILAFFSVLITYFGVNFFLGGLHSYA